MSIDGRKTLEPTKSIRVRDAMILAVSFLKASVFHIIREHALFQTIFINSGFLYAEQIFQYTNLAFHDNED